jgi:4'-phosphopantetheinyl transferase EntD
VSINPQFLPKMPLPVALLNSLFPATVIVTESRLPGDPETLLPSERYYVAQARAKRLQEFAAGRACARLALAEFGIQGFALRAAEDRQPLWPTGFVGSITHTTGLCAAAVARRTDVTALGLDSEIVGAPTLDIWPTICRDEELRWIESLPAAQRPSAVTLLFSAKEAFYKCQYPLVSEWLDFHDLRLEVGGWGDRSARFSVFPTRQIRFASYVSVPIEGSYLFHDEFVSAGVTVVAQ